LFADGLEEVLPDRLRELAADVTVEDHASS
jgi:hypothetical protein